MIYEYDAFIEVPEKLGEDKMVELDCAIAYFVEDEFGYPVEFSVLGQVDEKSGNCEIEKVVRCKDCKFGAYEKGHGIYHTRCEILEFLFQDDDYCSYGERKEE